MRRLALLLLLLAACSSERAAEPSPPTAPDAPSIAVGQIAFVRDSADASQIYLVNADGSALTRLTYDASRKGRPSWSPDGTRMAFTGTVDGVDEIYAMSVVDDPSIMRLTHDGVGSRDPAWSPDGSTIAFVRSAGAGAGIYLMKPDGSDITPLTHGPAEATSIVRDAWPAWSADGSRIAFVRNLLDDLTPAQIYIMKADGSDVALLNPGAQGYAEASPAWSPDGRSVLFWSFWSTPGFALKGADGFGSMQRISTSIPASYSSHPDWSPDGRWVAFASSSTGIPSDVYIMHSDGSALVRLTAGGSSEPAWRRRR
jgi:TolB protein